MVIVGLQLVLPALALPNPLEVVGRKFAAKPNDKKKVTTETNEITTVDNGFSWQNIIGIVAQMILGTTGLDKADSGLNAHQGGFNWMNLVNLGLRLMLSTLSNTGNDKADTATSASPLQLIQIFTSLMDALKVSFAQRSSNARSMGSKDVFSDAAIAAVTIMKGYVRTHRSTNGACIQRDICAANRECSDDAPESGFLFCQLGTYAAGTLLSQSTSAPLDVFTQAGRYGRTGESCAEIYSECDEP